MKISPAVKVGFLTLLSVSILIFSVMWLKGRSISAGERIEVAFQDVDGMRPGSAVQMMGIRIGQVEDVIPVIKGENSFVKVRFVITEPDIEIPFASIVSIQQSGIIGEKFIEVTPPQLQTTYLEKNAKTQPFIGAEVNVLQNSLLNRIGEIKNVEVLSTKEIENSSDYDITTDYAYKISYIVDKPGFVIPEESISHFKKGHLIFKVPNDEMYRSLSLNSKYTVVEPMRLRKFMELQLESARALKETNDKINDILSKESIADLKQTLKNTKDLTGKAAVTLDEATKLIKGSREELDTLTLLVTGLSNKMIVLTDNINSIVGDPALKGDLLATAKSIQKSTKELSEILADERLKETIGYVHSTSKDVSLITSDLASVSKDKNFQGKLDKTVTEMNDSMEKLSRILTSVDNLTSTQEKKLQTIIEDASGTTENLKKFSDKLNKRFLLFRLMF